MAGNTNSKKKAIPPKKIPPKEKPLPKKGKNKAIEISGELCVIIHLQSGEEGKEIFCQSQIVVSYDIGDPMKNISETVILPPLRTKLLLKLLDFEQSDFVKKHYEK
jgi:hypothetical protein